MYNFKNLNNKYSMILFKMQNANSHPTLNNMRKSKTIVRQLKLLIIMHLFFDRHFLNSNINMNNFYSLLLQRRKLLINREVHFFFYTRLKMLSFTENFLFIPCEKLIFFKHMPPKKAFLFETYFYDASIPRRQICSLQFINNMKSFRSVIC